MVSRGRASEDVGWVTEDQRGLGNSAIPKVGGTKEENSLAEKSGTAIPLPSTVNFHPLADGLPSAGVRKNACRTRIRSQINGCCLVRTSRRVGGVRRAAYSFVMLTGVVGKVLGTPSLVSRLLLGVLEGTAVACSERDCR